jgi:hypothetical protein
MIMTFDWTISENRSLKQRAQRHRLAVDISLSMGFESWQIMWPMKLINISISGVLVEFPVGNPQDASKANDLLKILNAEPNVRLQLAPSNQELLPATIDAILIRYQKTSRGLELAFNYDDRTEELQQIFTNIPEQQI